MNTLDQHDWHETLDVLCHSSAHQILEGISFSEFRERMVGMLEFLLDAMAIPEEVRTPEMKQSMATLVALEIWNPTPIPENRCRRSRSAMRPACADPAAPARDKFATDSFQDADATP